MAWERILSGSKSAAPKFVSRPSSLAGAPPSPPPVEPVPSTLLTPSAVPPAKPSTAMSASVKNPRKIVFQDDEEAAAMAIQVLLNPSILSHMSAEDVQDLLKRTQRLVLTGGSKGISFQDLFVHRSESEQQKLHSSLEDGSLLLIMLSIHSKNM
jgi:hypothetical protein